MRGFRELYIARDRVRVASKNRELPESAVKTVPRDHLRPPQFAVRCARYRLVAFAPPRSQGAQTRGCPGSHKDLQGASQGHKRLLLLTLTLAAGLWGSCVSNCPAQLMRQALPKL